MPKPRTPAAKQVGPVSAAGEAAAGEAADSGQSHPLYSIDRATVNRLLAAETPEEADLIDAARLLTRYTGFPGAYDLQDDLGRAIRHWGLATEDLQARARALWQGGYQRGAKGAESEPVGSGFDASANAEG